MNIRLSDFHQLLGGSQQFRDLLEREHIAKSGSYIQFVQRLYRDIDPIIFGMQTERHLRQKDGEDRLTTDICFGLRQLGYRATHDTQKGGHIDLDVSYGPNSWIGEAKKDGSFRQGFLQLTTRYVPSSGDYSHNHGGLVFYLVNRKDAAGKMKRWAKELSQLGARRICDCGGNRLAMYSEHILDGPGTEYTIRSMFVTLYHSPQDASAMKSAARRAAVSGKKAKKLSPKKPGTAP